jgi:hypothetical protein
MEPLKRDSIRWRIWRSDQATLLLIENARPLLAAAEAEELAPLALRIEQVLKIENEAHLLQAVRALRADLPLLTRQIARNPKAAKVYYEVFGAALLNGYAGAAAQRQLPEQNHDMKKTPLFCPTTNCRTRVPRFWPGAPQANRANPRGGVALMANEEDGDEAEGSRIVGLANAFQATADDWIQLAPNGRSSPRPIRPACQ